MTVPGSSAALTKGAIIDGRYEVTLALGAGGMGEVYEVIHLGLHKPFALKCLKTGPLQDPRAAQRFMKEIRGLAAVHSEFVVAICDCGKLETGAPFFVMERLRGRDLRKLLLEAHALASVRAIKLTLDACFGLQAVHDAGLIHRDLKPENLFVTGSEEGSECCKVLDFGIAKTVGTGSTGHRSLLGTLTYMAPEQMVDASSVGPATDIYGLGAILYECLAGRPPHVAETEPELMFKIMNTDPLSLMTLLPSLDPTLASVVARTLHRDPERRYGSAVALASALASCLVKSSEEVRHEDAPEQQPSPLPMARFNPRIWTLGALAIAGLAGAGVAAQRHERGVPPSVLAPSVVPLCRNTPQSSSSSHHSDPPFSADHAEAAPATGGARLPRRSEPTAASRNIIPTLPAIDERNPYE